MTGTRVASSSGVQRSTGMPERREALQRLGLERLCLVGEPDHARLDEELPAGLPLQRPPLVQGPALPERVVAVGAVAAARDSEIRRPTSRAGCPARYRSTSVTSCPPRRSQQRRPGARSPPRRPRPPSSRDRIAPPGRWRRAWSAVAVGCGWLGPWYRRADRLGPWGCRTVPTRVAHSPGQAGCRHARLGPRGVPACTSQTEQEPMVATTPTLDHAQQPHRRRSRPRADPRVRPRLGPHGDALAGARLRLGQLQFSSTAEDKLVTLINQARASAGLPALNDNAALHDVARWRSKDMWDRNYFSHSIPNPPGGNVFDELHRPRHLLHGRRREHRREQLPRRPDRPGGVQRLDELVRPPGDHPRHRLQPRRHRRLQGRQPDRLPEEATTPPSSATAAAAATPTPTPTPRRRRPPSRRRSPRRSPTPTPTPTPHATPHATPDAACHAQADAEPSRRPTPRRRTPTIRIRRPRHARPRTSPPTSRRRRRPRRPPDATPDPDRDPARPGRSDVDGGSSGSIGPAMTGGTGPAVETLPAADRTAAIDSPAGRRRRAPSR